ncbi:MAG: lytic transglycosylase domain-containing protein [Candidatus Methanoperedens sp.]|nr:lytic transglycosylase domain-containing protein [Candidatus Methanoperedens sp.]
MTYSVIIAAAAKAAKVSSVLLYAICQYESRDFSVDYSKYDNGSPSYSVCQVKEDTARMLGFKGKASELRNAKVGIKYAALYLRYQEDRYGDDWCKITAAYNAGSFNESKKLPGKPRNLKYVRRVQKQLDDEYKSKLSCETNGN